MDDRARDAFNQTRRHRLNRFGGIRIVEDDATEFITAKPCQQRFRRCYLTHARRDRAENGIARFVPVKIINPFEIIKIKHEESKLTLGFAGLHEQFRRIFCDPAAIGEAGQRIGNSKLVRPVFRRDPLAHFTHQLTVAAPAKYDERNIQQ